MLTLCLSLVKNIKKLSKFYLWKFNYNKIYLRVSKPKQVVWKSLLKL